MFKKTLNFSELKSDPAVLATMKDGDVFQIFHRGQDVKVLMTQEYFFNLMAKLERAEDASKTTPFDAKQLLADLEKKLGQIRDVVGKEGK